MNPGGWQSEDILFYGSDGRWRQLRMEELGLPEEDWFADTYGAGSLSHDGRWRTGPTGGGTVVLERSTGTHEVLGSGSMAGATWIPGTSAFISSTYDFKRPGSSTIRIDRRDGAVARAPYRQWQIGFGPDGTAVSVTKGEAGAVQLVEWIGDGRQVRTHLSERLSTAGRAVMGVVAPVTASWPPPSTRGTTTTGRRSQ